MKLLVYIGWRREERFCFCKKPPVPEKKNLMNGLNPHGSRLSRGVRTAGKPDEGQVLLQELLVEFQRLQEHFFRFLQIVIFFIIP